MEELIVPIQLLHKALFTLKKSFDVIEKAQKSNDADYEIAAQDSSIQRFEYCYDSFWKFLKRYLEIKHLIETEEISSPKKVFRKCVKIEICSPKEGEILIQMSDARNITSHNYDIDKVREIVPHLTS